MAKTLKASIIEDVLLEEILGNKELEADQSEDKTEMSDEAQDEEGEKEVEESAASAQAAIIAKKKEAAEKKHAVTESDAQAIQDKKDTAAIEKGEDIDTDIADTKQVKSGKVDPVSASANKAPGETDLKNAKKATEVIVAESADSDEDDIKDDEVKENDTSYEDDEVKVTATADSDEDAEVVVAHDGEDDAEKSVEGETVVDEDKSEESDEDDSEESEESEDDEEDAELKHCDFSDDIAALDAVDSGLTEAYKTKAAAIFEAAVTSKLREKSKSLRESYQRQLDKKTAAVSEQMLTQIDRYLTHVAESYVEKNVVAIDANLRGELAESFIQNLHSVFTEHYVEVPVAKRDLAAELELKVASLEESVAKQESRNKILAESVVAYKRAEIIESLTESLAATQVSKVKSLLEGVSYKDAVSFRAKVETIVESYTNRPAKQDINQNPLETITESARSSTGNSIIDATLAVLKNLK